MIILIIIFFKGVRNLAIKKMIIDEDSAFVLVNYELISPKGNKFNADVAEMWSIKNNKLDSIAIYFDTAYFQKEMS